MSMDTYGIIGFTSDNVGIDKRIFINSSGYSADSTFNVSYNAGRVDVYLNGIKLVGKQNSSQSYWDFTYTTEGQGNSITLATGTALTSSDVLEVIGFVSNSGNTVTTYNFTLSGSQQAFTANHVASDLVNVFLNGVRLDAADFTLNGSDTVTLGSTAVNGDVVHIQVIGALDNSNFVPASGGTFSGNVVFSGNTSGLDVNGTELILDADGDTSITADTDDRIDFKTAGTDRVHIDSSGNVGVGDSSPDAKMQINQTGSDYAVHITNPTNTTNYGNGLAISVLDENTTSYPLYINSNSVTAESGNHRFSVRADGETEITGGNLVIGTAGKGIDFSNQTGTSNPDSGGEVLDHYEEGLFDLTLISSGYSFGSYTQHQNCRYTKIGRQVFLHGRVKFSTVNSSQNSYVELGNLPFTPGGSHIGTGVAIESSTSTSVYSCHNIATTNRFYMTSREGHSNGSTRTFGADNHFYWSLAYTV